jgi:AcrR family transcriptional regulator
MTVTEHAIEPGTPSRGRRRDPEGNRRRILEAATQEFARKGFGGARTDAIAAAAGVNERMLYYYFGSKDGLFRCVLEEAYLALIQAERALDLEALDPISAFRRLVEFIWNYYLDHPELIRLVNSENLHEARHLRQSDKVGELVSPMIAVITDLLRRGEAQGVIRPGIDPVQCYITIAAIGYFFLSNRHTLQTVLARDLSSQEARRAHLAHNTEVVLSFLRPQS